MEEKSAKQILFKHLERTNTEIIDGDMAWIDDGDITDVLIDAMKEYAKYEIKKHLEIAAEKAKLNVEYCRMDIDILEDLQFTDDYGDTNKVWVNKESIIGIKIEL